MNVNKLILYFYTVKYLKPKQFLYNFIRRLNTRVYLRGKSVPGLNDLLLQCPIKYKNKIDSKSVCFLNKRRNLVEITDWECKEESKLWRYNLHYFDYLLDDGVTEDIKDALINDWIEKSPYLREDAWEPYPISIRLVNWIKYFIVYKENSIPDSWLLSLYQQAYALNNLIEYHILANHYFKNGKGLLFAGAYLNCSDSNNWFNKGKQILLEEADVQILSDGGHFEKSPMYHSIFVEDCLDVISLIQSNTLGFSQQEISFLHKNTAKALDFLNSILMPDGEIPFFNDSAFNIAPRPELIFKYAKQVLEYVRNDNSTVQLIIAHEYSGYYIIKDDQNMCVIDCGSVSPDYQPGHTHCDLLSHELVIGGQRCIVNSGLHDYENSEERRYCRSTRAHNTVEIDCKEQTEIWGQFRVARRAKVLSASLNQYQDGACVFKGSYSPYWSGKDNIVHSREVKYIDKQWIFNDVITGNGMHTVCNFIHIHPDVDCVKENDVYFLIKDAIKLAKITFSDTVNVTEENGWYYPEFGIKRKNTVLRLSINGLLPINQGYVIEPL